MLSRPIEFPPPSVALARAVDAIPRNDAMPGGSRYEPKFDGFRAVLDRRGDQVRVWSRQGKDLASAFPDLGAAAIDQVPEDMVVDGEAVVWWEGRLDFGALQQRLARRGGSIRTLARQRPASFAAFDVLAVAGHDATRRPWLDRRALLEALASEWSPPLHLSPVTTELDEASSWFDDLPSIGIEGLVVKGAAQRYEGGQRQWLKVKHRDTLDVVCAAVIGPRTRPTELVAGLPVDGRLQMVGRSTPLGAKASRELGGMLSAPFGGHPWPETVKPAALDRFSGSRQAIALTLVEPVVVEVSADVAWSGRSFRHPLRFVRLRPEMTPVDVELPAFLKRS